MNLEFFEEEKEAEDFDEGDLDIIQDRKISLEKVDRSISELKRWYDKGRLVIDPEWQRNYVWDNVRASKLIESFLLDIPVPVIYLSKTDDQKYEVIDGLQRLTSIFKFLDNKFDLNRLDVLKELKGSTYSRMPEKYQNKLEDAILRTFEIASDSGDMRFLVFERLNTGGMKLNDMELRNCIYRGKLNNLIKEISETSKDFQKSVNQKGFDKRMNDRAFILRFLAFYEKTHFKCEKGLKSFLNDFFRTYQNCNDSKIDEYKKIFEKCMKASITVFGENAFRLKAEIKKQNSKSSGEWATRPNAAIFQVISTSFSRYDIGKINRAADSIYEEYLDMISTDEKWVDHARRATSEATRLTYVFDTWHSRLASVLNDYTPNDSKRLFSKNLKREMFEANPTCSICEQKISLLDDAALDHDKRYWMGGKTVPENARLTHRLCNLKRG